VTAANTADFSALAAWAPAAGGKRGTLSIGYRNSGPASIFYRSGNAVVTVQAQIPKGVKVTTVPSGCRARTWEAGHQVADPDKYLCDSSMWVPSGSQAVFAFGLALDGTPATVPVTLQDESSLSGDRPAAELAFDPKHANDATSVTLGSTPSGSLPSASPSSTPGGATATPPAVVRPTGSATPSAPPTTPSATATTSGGLAFTGATGIGPMLGIGVAAVALGGGVLVAVRRRKAGSHH
jgi:hypothetical protein